ncbi:TIR domain-containing protein [Halorientalis brevis]|uniref:TIR domain-containing protein n=1 Tax=Halorientalis brevis TaxID=1126241 RepID=A0ABD6CDL8_9EURY|nr:TIR domain-containing protein [Halorientalis brevis]
MVDVTINEVELSKNRRDEYSLFISHSWDYEDDYERLVDLLEEKNYFQFRNYSVPQEEEIDASSNAELRQHLREKQIGPSSVVLVLAGMYSEHSYWIKKEMQIAEDLGKSIVGVKPWGQERTPEEVKDAADTMVGWNGGSIVDAIRTNAP